MTNGFLVYPARLARQKDGSYLVRFPDLPEAITDGDDRADALQEAIDCLSEALASRIADNEEIPAPSPMGRNLYQVAPAPAIALKAALHQALGEAQMSIAQLARKLGIDHKEARRLLDPHHPTKLPRMTEALAQLGRNVAVAVYDSERRGKRIVYPESEERAA